MPVQPPGRWTGRSRPVQDRQCTSVTAVQTVDGCLRTFSRKPDRSDLCSSHWQACNCHCRRLVAAVQFTSRNQMFTQLVIKTYLSNVKVWLPSPFLLGMVVLFLSLTGEQRTEYAYMPSYLGMVPPSLSIFNATDRTSTLATSGIHPSWLNEQGKPHGYAQRLLVHSSPATAHIEFVSVYVLRILSPSRPMEHPVI